VTVIPTFKHDSKAELAVLGCMMHAARDGDQECLDQVFDLLRSDDFFDAPHRAIFASMEAMRDAREPIDPQLVARHCGVEHSAALLLVAIDSVTGTATVASYAKIVAGSAKQRRVVTAALDALQGARDSEPEAVIRKLHEDLEALHKAEGMTPLTTGAEAASDYMRFLSLSDQTMPRTALPELNYAIGGGVDYGEMVVLAARPSHGKTAVALQFVHNWTADGLPVLYISLEMSANALGKRIMQYSSAVPEENWRRDIGGVRSDVENYLGQRAEWFIADNLNTCQEIAREIERSVRHRGIKAAVVDYAQLIQSPGKSRYEQITHTSTVLRGLASEHRIILLVLCQMSRDIESRKKFLPIMSDIKESGQFEQDADVVIFVVWPHRIDSSQPAHEYQFFVAKNRNRPILTSAFTARFEPSRQRVLSPRVQDMPNYVPSFQEYDHFNQD
jgi:replicative DNA helicase